MNCRFPDCDRPARPLGLCDAHYMQQRRTGTLRPLASGDLSEQVSFRLPRYLKRAALRAARDAGITEGEWWRQIAKHKLEEP